MRILAGAVLTWLIFISPELNAEEIRISSLEELATYASESGNVILMSPGVYPLSDYLTADSMVSRSNRGLFQFITFSGNNNVFRLNGVEIEVDTDLRNSLKPPIHTSEFLISGNDNTLDGLTIRYFGSGTSPGGAALEVAGRDNVLRNITLRVTGSFPYGYGDLFGKGGPDVIRHRKHSGLLVTGSNTRLYACRLYMRSFGHGFYVQKNAENIYFEDCYVEGEVRATADILKETSGPAFDVGFRTWTKNREGEYRVTPGYMKSLCEDGFRTYGQIKNIHFRNCTAKNTRGGFELRTNGGIRLEDCTTIGTERAYWVGEGAVVKNCKGDASYGPLIFIEGSNVDVEMVVVPAESRFLVHAMATIQGKDNHVVFKSENAVGRTKEIPILIGYTHPEHGESMSPFGEGETAGLKLINETGMPLIIGEQAADCVIETNGEVLENRGRNIQITLSGTRDPQIESEGMVEDHLN